MSRKIVFFILLLCSFDLYASIVLNGTRIIYPEGVGEKNLVATNKGEKPFAAQVWVESDVGGSDEASGDKSTAPFFVTPAISKILPNTGQAIRIIYTGANLPADRESVFYFNMLQIPAVSSQYAGENALQVMVQDRLKLFYRPSGVEGEVSGVKDKISFEVVNSGGASALRVVNPTGYYASFADAKVYSSGVAVEVEHSMVPPFSEVIWVVPAGVKLAGNTKFEASLVNDYGGLEVISKNL